MKKVLIALDYAPTAEKVAESGFLLAKSMNAQTILLHVIADVAYYSNLDFSPIMGFSGIQNFTPIDTADLIKPAEEFLEKTKNHLGDNNIQTFAIQGDFSTVILETAIEQNADVIVLGSHSRKWVEKILMGSVTEKVLEHSTIPLFIVPTKI